MTSGAVQGPILRYAYHEIQRRWNRIDDAGSVICSSPQDLMDLVEVLQRMENHLLATRIMLSSWCTGTSIGSALSSSLLSLGRKLLSYRSIDSSFAVACFS